MRVVVSRLAQSQYDRQIDYIIEQSSPEAAGRLRDRLDTFICETLARFPHIGPPVSECIDLRQVVVPHTRLILHYRVTGPDLVEIAAIRHAAKDRPSEPDY